VLYASKQPLVQEQKSVAKKHHARQLQELPLSVAAEEVGWLVNLVN
jgi:hypothetical protein